MSRLLSSQPEDFGIRWVSGRSSSASNVSCRTSPPLAQQFNMKSPVLVSCSSAGPVLITQLAVQRGMSFAHLLDLSTKACKQGVLSAGWFFLRRLFIRCLEGDPIDCTLWALVRPWLLVGHDLFEHPRIHPRILDCLPVQHLVSEYAVGRPESISNIQALRDGCLCNEDSISRLRKRDALAQMFAAPAAPELPGLGPLHDLLQPMFFDG